MRLPVVLVFNESRCAFIFRLKYDIVGHSGDGCDIELVRADKVPKNNKERLKVIKVSTWTYTLTLPLKYLDFTTQML